MWGRTLGWRREGLREFLHAPAGAVSVNFSDQQSMSTGFNVTPLEALSDNYMYLIVDEATKQAAVVDPVEPQKCLKAAQDVGATIVVCLTTHHHFDHAGGNKELKELAPGVEIIGGEDVQSITRRVKDGEVVSVGGLQVTCVHTPAHTSGHTSYLVTGEGASTGSLFTGDALFVGGCGRFFEGTPQQMLATSTKFASLPHDTTVYCGHEYTIKNLQFGLHVEPKNADAERKILWAQDVRAKGNPTVPSTIGEELAYNPFMRVREPTVREHVGGGADDVDVMRKLRNAKDNFAGSSRPWIPGGGPFPGL